MSRTIIFNGSSIVSSTPNVMTRTFSPNFEVGEDEEMCLLNCFINYSWFNITSYYQNNTVGYKMPQSATVYPINFGNAFLQVSDISTFIQDVMIQNGHYLVNSFGQNVTFFSCQTNPSSYGITCVFTPLPSSLPSGWSNPANLTLSTGNAYTPQLIFDGLNFSTLFGFNKNTTVPATPSATTLIVNSVNTPQLTPYAGNFIACNLVNEPNLNANIIYSFTPNVGFGSQIVIEPKIAMWYQCDKRKYPSITLSFYDGNYNPLQIVDPNIIATIAIRKINNRN
jgi:hypothetical protein